MSEALGGSPGRRAWPVWRRWADWGERRVAVCELPALTTVLFVAAVGTVLKAITPEAADNAVDATGTGEERRAAF